VGSKAAALVDLSTVAGNKISNPPWVKFQSAGWVNFPSAPTVLSPDECKTLEALSDKLLRKLVRNLDQAYSACRLCDPKACQDCPCRSRGVDEL
jgi:hypothetical protein